MTHHSEAKSRGPATDSIETCKICMVLSPKVPCSPQVLLGVAVSFPQCDPEKIGLKSVDPQLRNLRDQVATADHSNEIELELRDSRKPLISIMALHFSWHSAICYCLVPE